MRSVRHRSTCIRTQTASSNLCKHQRRDETFEWGIKVNVAAVGPVWTHLTPARMKIKAQDEFTAPTGRPSQPSEITVCVVFVAKMGQ
jgi:NAD(P)-dependent dehydrogenase (short-subunit alcohol dehydrogenase family)